MGHYRVAYDREAGLLGDTLIRYGVETGDDRWAIATGSGDLLVITRSIDGRTKRCKALLTVIVFTIPKDGRIDLGIIATGHNCQTDRRRRASSFNSVELITLTRSC